MILARLLAGKGALYIAIAGGLAVLLLASNLGWWARAAVLGANLREAEAEGRTTATERDAWKTKTSELAAANRAGQQIVTALQAELTLAQGEARRLEADVRAAIAAARADAQAAARQLAEFSARYAAQRAAPDCAGALAAVQQHCPQFEGY